MARRVTAPILDGLLHGGVVGPLPTNLVATWQAIGSVRIGVVAEPDGDQVTAGHLRFQSVQNVAAALLLVKKLKVTVSHAAGDFASTANVDELHYAFLVSEDEFDAIYGRIQAEEVSYGSGPSSADDGTINTRRGGRGLYFSGGPDPHLWEIMTRPETGS